MIKLILEGIKSFFKGHKRTIKAKKNILASLIIKGTSMVIGFLMIRVTLNYLDDTKYGIWLTLTSFLTWFTFFEIGLGSGLKNKLAEALAVKDYNLGRIYVSTTYAILTIVISCVALAFFITNNFLDWSIILNTDKELAQELSLLALIVFGFFFLFFVIKLIGIVFTADQRPAIANSFGPLANLLSLILIYILTLTTEGSLIYIALVLSISPLVILSFVTIYFFSNDYKHIAPSIHFVNFKYAKGLFNLGLKFFIINISALIMFQSSNIIIAQFFGPKEVTPYNIAYKLFSIILMLFTIIISPFLVTFTEAWVKKEIGWIKNTVKNLFFVWLGFVVIAIILFFISDFFFKFWLGSDKMETIIISTRLKVLLIIYFLLFTFGGIFNMFINGVSKISIQMYSLLIGAILFVPISIFFIKYLHWGIESVVMASILSNFYSPFLAPLQYFKIINKKAHGIWNK